MTLAARIAGAFWGFMAGAMAMAGAEWAHEGARWDAAVCGLLMVAFLIWAVQCAPFEGERDDDG